MREKIEQMRQAISDTLCVGLGREGFSKLREQYLSRAGEIPGLMKEMKNIPKEERPEFGKIVNEFKQWAESRFDEVEEALRTAELAAKNASEAVDVTMPAEKNEIGALHPVSLVKSEIISIFQGMGFDVFEGPEIETDYYNFTALNVPEDHPARAEQDTFYITENILLRTQTSPGQIRTMEVKKPPIKVLSPGRVFRSD